MRCIAFTLMVALLASVATPARAGEEEIQRANNALRVLTEVMQAPDKAIPKDLLANAHAIAVIPDVIKAGFVIGGRRGEGLVSVKTRDGTWSNPSFIGLTGGSIGFQAGVSSTDVILVFRTQRGVESIVNGKFTI
ncbi:MAG: lipid-binding SYLF domain-containing protein, partial [Dokdonella sp.]